MTRYDPYITALMDPVRAELVWQLPIRLLRLLSLLGCV
jgi:hypothetical protein